MLLCPRISDQHLLLLCSKFISILVLEWKDFSTKICISQGCDNMKCRVLLEINLATEAAR